MRRRARRLFRGIGAMYSEMWHMASDVVGALDNPIVQEESEEQPDKLQGSTPHRTIVQSHGALATKNVPTLLCGYHRFW